MRAYKNSDKTHDCFQGLKQLKEKTYHSNHYLKDSYHIFKALNPLPLIPPKKTKCLFFIIQTSVKHKI